MFVGPDFFDQEELPPVIIIGSGPAGITTALGLADRGIRSLILEAGDYSFVPEIQDQYIGTTSGEPYYDLDITRLRQFGGSSAHWEGWCRPMDAWDFDAVPSANVPGWPISRPDLEPYADQTHDILEIEAPVDQPLNDDIFEAGFAHSPPVRFADKYEAQIEASDLIFLTLRTPLLAMSAENGRVTALDIVDANGTRRRITSNYVVLACGGIENSRLLLWSNEASPEPVVANANSLGRYWMEHPHARVGNAVLFEQVHVNPQTHQNDFAIGVRPEKLAEFGAMNVTLRLRYIDHASFLRQAEGAICSLAPELVETAASLAQTRTQCGLEVLAVWEQPPDFDNRVELSASDRDVFGIPRPHLHWRRTELGFRTAKVAFELIGKYLLESGKGMLQAERHLIDMDGYPETGWIGGHHHMGGTRMSESAQDGIVDENLRIHGMANAYVAGSSVFVRGGHANPTYTIVQLSLRLAEHLAAELAA